MPSSNGSTVPSDHDLVAALLKDDSEAWIAVLKRAAAVVEGTRRYREQASRFSFSAEEVVSRLYLNLRTDDCRRLRAFRFGSSLSTFLWYEVRTAVRMLVREVSGPPGLVLTPDGPMDAESGPSSGMDDFADDAGRGDAARTAITAERLRSIQRAFAGFYHASPVAAYVLLLRGETGLSSKEVSEFLGLQAANVDQIFHRARRRYADLLRQEEDGPSDSGARPA